MKKGIDFKAAATKMAGHAAGAAAYTQLSHLQFMKNIGKDKTTGLVTGPMKGLVTALIGYIAVPMIAEKMKLSGKGGKADFVQHVGEGIGMVGIMQAANAQFPGKTPETGLFPQIAGYEENPISGLGMITEEDDSDQYQQSVSGYELADDVVS